MDRYPFSKVPEGDHVVRGELIKADKTIEFEWPATLKDGCLYPAEIIDMLSGKSR